MKQDKTSTFYILQNQMMLKPFGKSRFNFIITFRDTGNVSLVIVLGQFDGMTKKLNRIKESTIGALFKIGSMQH